MRRYKLIDETLIASATSRTVRRRCSSSTIITFGCGQDSLATIVNSHTSLKDSFGESGRDPAGMRMPHPAPAGHSVRQAPPPRDELVPGEHEGHRAGGQERTE